jgi:TetR/AcrR family transcriptional regulator, ethionamide resistance regulator
MAGDRPRAPIRRRDLTQDLGRRRGEEGGDAREAILSATERLLADRRLEDLTVVDIIEAAGISRATFYLYFESKHAPVAALAQEVLDGLDEELWAAWLAGDEPATESVMAEHWLQTIKRWRQHQVVLISAAHGWRTQPDAYARWGATFQRYVARVVQYIEQARARHGAPSDLDASTLAAMLTWLNESSIYMAFTGQAPELADDEQLARTLAGVWMRAIYGSSV